MERLWKKQALAISTNRSTFRAMSGNFQRQVCWDSSGYVYILTAEDDGSGNVPRISVYRSMNNMFDLSAGFSFQADTQIANGYDSDYIRSLAEFSASLRNDKIYIAANFANPPTIVSGVVIIAYDINTKTFQKVDYLASSTGIPPTPIVNSVDISLSMDHAHGDIIASWLEYDSSPISSYVLRRCLREILPNINTSGAGGAGRISEVITGTPYKYPCHLSNFDGDSDLWGVLKTNDALMNSVFTLSNMPRQLIREAMTSTNSIYLGTSNGMAFGNFKSLYNPKFNIEILAHWRRLASPKAGWELDLGVRGPDGINLSFAIVEFEYSNLGVTNVLTQLPQVCPEVLLIHDDQGGMYVIGSYPDPGSRPLSGAAGPGRIDNPYYNIAMAYWASDDFDSLSGANYETVWNGASTQTQLRFLSAPDILPAGESSTIRSSRLFLTGVDTLNDPQGQAVLYRE